MEWMNVGEEEEEWVGPGRLYEFFETGRCCAEVELVVSAEELKGNSKYL